MTKLSVIGGILKLMSKIVFLWALCQPGTGMLAFILLMLVLLRVALTSD